MEKIIERGAEAILIEKDGSLIKRRIKKGYRHSELDKKIREGRTRREARILEKAGKIISVPSVISSDDKKAEIEMKFIEGKRLSDWLDKIPGSLAICTQIGEEIGKLHDANIIHGDLTTSNMILQEGKVWFIDFGLGFHSERLEDKAVDLHLMKQALESRHFEKFSQYFDAVLRGYKRTSKKSSEVLEQFKKVESRGRYKDRH